MKGLLGAQGIADYWSDQPVGLNTVHVALSLFGVGSIGTLRGASISFAAVLVVSLFASAVRSSGWFAACIAGFGLVLSRDFLQLSVAVLIGLPAYALGLAAAASLVLGDGARRPALWTVASGIMLALGAHIKLSALLVAPALLLWLHYGGRYEAASVWRRNRALAVWTGSFVGAFLLPWLLKPDNFWIILNAHWGAGTRSAFAGATAPHVDILRLMGENWFLAGPAMLGLLVCAVRRRREGLIPSVWFLTALGVHLWHRPFWHHHFLHLSVPMAWLAGLFIGELVEQFRGVTWEQLMGRGGSSLIPAFSPGGGEGGDRGSSGDGKVGFWRGQRFVQAAAWMWVLLPCLFLSAFLAELPARWEKETAFLRVDDSKDWECVEVMKQYKAQTRWVFADDALYPFHAGMLTPPEIAVLSNKRLRAGLITQPELLNLLVHYRAEQVLVRRRIFDEKFMRYVEQRYTPVFEHGSLQLFIRNDLVKKQPENAKTAQAEATAASPAGGGSAL